VERLGCEVAAKKIRKYARARRLRRGRPLGRDASNVKARLQGWFSLLLCKRMTLGIVLTVRPHYGLGIQCWFGLHDSGGGFSRQFV
jgi:hypothetical protein